jgi:hypothetical protein
MDTHQKALSINLEAAIFGSFAEIGAGQEVARWFLRVGGASGTVAKTISAYDKEVSDDLYGAGTRYVSEPRLQAMLKNEWDQLLGQLGASRGATTRFFSFVDTISARNYSGTNECHGWLGLRFQMQPGGPPSDIILHVNLRDPSNVLQQEAVGVLGVNLLYAAHQHPQAAEEFLASLFEELSRDRIEIDLVEFGGPAFVEWDRNKVHASLVSGGYAEAVVFPADGKLVAPTELLYKKAVVLAPGTFENVEEAHRELIQSALADLPADETAESKGAVGLFCIPIAPAWANESRLTVEQVTERVEQLRRLGSGVLVFRKRELYLMSAYVNRFTKLRIHFAIGLLLWVRALQDSYKDLAGSLLEAIARLFTQNVRVIAYPMPAKALEDWLRSWSASGWKWKETAGIVYADDLHPAEPLDHLYRYLLGTKFIQPVRPAPRNVSSASPS